MTQLIQKALASRRTASESFFSYYHKKTTPGAKVVFIGLCTEKKAEAQMEEVKLYVDKYGREALEKTIGDAVSLLK